MDNKILRFVMKQIVRLGGKINDRPSKPVLSPTLAALGNTVWPRHPYAHHKMDDAQNPAFFFFEFTELVQDGVNPPTVFRENSPIRISDILSFFIAKRVDLMI